MICGGEETEPGYFRDLKESSKNPLVKVLIEGRKDAPKNLVPLAIRKKNEAEKRSRERGSVFLRYDEVWCVLDVDTHDRLPEVRELASREGVELAISNPCFELWALLHFQDQNAVLSTKEAQTFLRKHLPGYKKILPFAKLMPFYEVAVQRARKLEARSGDGNPSTGVYRLTELIRTEGRDTTGTQIRKMRGFLRGSTPAMSGIRTGSRSAVP